MKHFSYFSRNIYADITRINLKKCEKNKNKILNHFLRKKCITGKFAEGMVLNNCPPLRSVRLFRI